MGQMNTQELTEFTRLPRNSLGDGLVDHKHVRTINQWTGALSTTTTTSPNMQIEVKRDSNKRKKMMTPYQITKCKPKHKL
jgi:hypothetical protein